MKVIQCINNNVAVCIDDNNNEVVAFGKGVGFKKPPYEIELKQIERAYYGVSSIYISMINDLSSEIIEVSDQIVNYARSKLEYYVSSNIVFTLADHIQFSIKRKKENMKIRLPIFHDINLLFEKEVEIGKYGLRLIQNKLGIDLSKDESAYIALHFINAKTEEKNGQSELKEEVIQEVVHIIENHFDLKIDKDGPNYSRFISHMYYFLKRFDKREMISSDNEKLFKSLIKTFPDTYNCTIKIREYFKLVTGIEISDEECLYLILHINRLCAREDCYH